jgi:hypothetical protein
MHGIPLLRSWLTIPSYKKRLFGNSHGTLACACWRNMSTFATQARRHAIAMSETPIATEYMNLRQSPHKNSHSRQVQLIRCPPN